MLPWYLLIASVAASGGLAFEDSCTPCICYRDFADCSNLQLQEIPETLPTSIRTLNLSGNDLSSVPSGIFENLSLLRILDLSFNKISLLENGSFVGLHRLQKLSLEGNRLPPLPRAYPGEVFKPLTRLKRLWIENNSYDDVPANSSYPEEALSVLSSLEELRIDGLKTVDLGKGFLSLSNLTVLRLDGGKCNTEMLSNTSFKNVPNLRFLSVSGCKLNQVETGTFLPLRQLKELNMSNNKGLTLEGACQSLYGVQNSSLEILDISLVEPDFAIGIVVRAKYTKYLSKVPLRALYMDHNRIQLIEDGAIQFLPPKLERVSLNRNFFTYGKYLWQTQTLSNLKALYIKDLHMPTIPPLLRKKRQMMFYHAGNGLLSHDTRDSVVTIPVPPNLTYIDCSNSVLNDEIPKMNFRNSAVQFLNLSRNTLYKWTGPVGGLQALEVLDLSCNYCDKLGADFFTQMPSLLSLNISGNYLGFDLANIHGQPFRSLTSLTELVMADDKIRELPLNIFVGLISLKFLDLSNNGLTQWGVSISHMKQLQLLNLRSNDLDALPVDLTEQLDLLAPPERQEGLKVLLADNVLKCTCDNVQFWSWLLRHQSNVNVADINGSSCQTWNKKTEVLTDLETLVTTLEQQCANYVGVFTGSFAIVVFVLSLAMYALMYRFRWKLRYLYHLSRWQRRQETSDQSFLYDAFISYADEDRGFVINDMRQHLEDAGLRLCIHHISFLAGRAISENILSAVHNSRKTVVVLSPDFLNSYWCDYEVQMAQMEEVFAKRTVLLVILYRPVARREISATLINIIRRDSYLEYTNDPQGEVVFWSNLAEAIQHE